MVFPKTQQTSFDAFIGSSLETFNLFGSYLVGCSKKEVFQFVFSTSLVLAYLFKLITGKPVFPARNDLKQLPVVIDICGSFADTPKNEWPELQSFAGIPKVNTTTAIQIILLILFNFFRER